MWLELEVCNRAKVRIGLLEKSFANSAQDFTLPANSRMTKASMQWNRCGCLLASETPCLQAKSQLEPISKLTVGQDSEIDRRRHTRRGVWYAIVESSTMPTDCAERCQLRAAGSAFQCALCRVYWTRGGCGWVPDGARAFHRQGGLAGVHTTTQFSTWLRIVAPA